MMASRQKQTKKTRAKTAKASPAASTCPSPSTSTVAAVIDQIAELRERAFLFETAAHMLVVGFIGEDGKPPRFYVQNKGSGARPANFGYAVNAACSLGATANAMKKRADALAAVHVNAAPEMLGPPPSVGEEPVVTKLPDDAGMEETGFSLIEVASLYIPRPGLAASAPP